jgi:hypothetical protein
MLLPDPHRLSCSLHRYNNNSLIEKVLSFNSKFMSLLALDDDGVH